MQQLIRLLSTIFLLCLFVLSVVETVTASSYITKEQPPFLELIHQDSQDVMAPSQDTPQQQQQQQKPPLLDILQKLPQAQIFASLVRDVDSATTLLSTEKLSTTAANANPQQAQQQQQQPSIIVFAPTNAALHALPQKPWKSSRDEDQFGTQAYEGEAGAERASTNLQQFVQRQIVLLGQEWREGERAKTVGGKQVWWEKSNGGSGKTLQPGSIKVNSIEHAGNGDIWLIEGVLGDG